MGSVLSTGLKSPTRSSVAIASGISTACAGREGSAGFAFGTTG